MKRLPIVVEQGLATTRLARERLGNAFVLRVGLDRLTCRRGCTHCCHYPLTISLSEGLLLYRALKERDQWHAQLKRDLERHSGLTFGTAPEAWLLAEIPCPLLVEQRCSAYEQRPFRCRTTVSTRDPDLCRTVYFAAHTFEDARVERVEFEATEIRSAKAIREHIRGLEQHVPLSTAVLVGHQIDEGLLAPEDLPQALLRLLSQGQ